MSARGVSVVGVKFWGPRGVVVVVDSEQSNRQFSYVRGFGGFVVVSESESWPWLVLGSGIGLGTRSEDGNQLMELS